jgi:hypothetical protein
MLPTMRSISISLIDLNIDRMRNTIKRNKIFILREAIREVTIQNIGGNRPRMTTSSQQSTL